MSFFINSMPLLSTATKKNFVLKFLFRKTWTQRQKCLFQLSSSTKKIKPSNWIPFPSCLVFLFYLFMTSPSLLPQEKENMSVNLLTTIYHSLGRDVLSFNIPVSFGNLLLLKKKPSLYWETMINGNFSLIWEQFLFRRKMPIQVLLYEILFTNTYFSRHFNTNSNFFFSDIVVWHKINTIIDNTMVKQKLREFSQ